MNKKVVDIAAYRIEKTLQQSGFAVKKDKNKKIKLLIKISAR